MTDKALRRMPQKVLFKGSKKRADSKSGKKCGDQKRGKVHTDCHWQENNVEINEDGQSFGFVWLKVTLFRSTITTRRICIHVTTIVFGEWWSESKLWPYTEIWAFTTETEQVESENWKIIWLKKV